MCKFRTLNSKGDEVQTYDLSVAEQKQQAQEQFTLMLKQGYGAMVVTPTERMMSSNVRDLVDDTQEVVFTLPLVGG